MKGTVVTLLGKSCTVRAQGPPSELFHCHLRGRLFETPGTQIAVGDLVELDPVDRPHPHDDTAPKAIGVIHEILPRRTALTRPPSRKGAQPQIVAANVDQLVVVSAIKSPALKTGLIDRYLLIADRAGITPAICVNKIDLADEPELKSARLELRPYVELRIPVIFTSARSDAGVPDLKALLQDQRSVLAGHSGAGKSKLAGRLQPGLSLVSSAVGRRGKGRHTTSASTLYTLDFGAELVDTPGVRELGISDFERNGLDHHFAEFTPLLGACQFKSCSHIPEPGCAIKDAVESGKIAAARYESYVRLYHELTPHASL